MNILIRPIKTEKSQKNAQGNSFTFEVNASASKFQVKQAIENNFDVDVVGCRTVHTHGKTRRFRRISRQLPDFKKAIVTLKEGQTIPLFETEKKKRSRKK